ncbi:MAG: PIG-L family deacetylase [Clostridia bacterium]|nr:PIG-L family deacetylase [Clostridia bacterium]
MKKGILNAEERYSTSFAAERSLRPAGIRESRARFPGHPPTTGRPAGMSSWRTALLLSLLLFLLLPVLAPTAGRAAGAEARDLTGRCTFSVSPTSGKRHSSWKNFTDGAYTTWWESDAGDPPFVEIKAKDPVHGLYLCFHTIPESYQVQVRTSGADWETVAEGNPVYAHAFFEIPGATEIRVLSTQESEPRIMGLNELFVFGEGEIPDWVQRWEPTEEKADILFAMCHPDDELIFLGGAIPTYDVEMGKRVVVSYVTYADKVRRSEALNGLWTMGVRTYPVFGPFEDSYSTKLETAYRKVDEEKGAEIVLSWAVELLRHYRPEVVVTHDLKGEYGHGQHKMIADAMTKAWDVCGDPAALPDSAALYGPWQPKKLYVHLYGDKQDRTRLDWSVPLESMGGKTGLELAIEAYRKHRTQMSLTVTIGGQKRPLSVQGTGKTFPNTSFGLYGTTVGPDVEHTDFLEHVDTAE